MKNKYQDAETFEFVPASNVTSGSLVLVGKYVGVAIKDVAAGERGVAVKTGKFVLPKGTGTAFSLGDALYWDATNGYLVKSASGNTFVGLAAKDAAAAATTAIVDLGYRGSL